MKHYLVIAIVAATFFGSAAAWAETFSSDVSARWARRVVGQNAAAQGVENIQGSGSAIFQNLFDVTVSGGNLVAAIPNNDGTNDAANVARNTAIVVANSDFGFPADNASFYNGSLLGDLTNRTLKVTFKLDTTKTDGTAFTANDFWGDKFNFTDSATPPDGVRNMVAFRRVGVGAPAENWWLAEGATLDVTTLNDNVYFTYSVDLSNKSLFNAVSGAGNATLFPADFNAVMANVSEVRFTFGSGFGALAGYAFANEGPTGTMAITEFTTVLVPEPSTLAFATVGLSMVGSFTRRRRGVALVSVEAQRIVNRRF